MNAFMVWARIERQNIASKYKDLKNAEISKILGKKWKDMNEEEKKPFREKANEIFREHLKRHPDYKYKPRRKIKAPQKCTAFKKINLNLLHKSIDMRKKFTARFLPEHGINGKEKQIYSEMVLHKHPNLNNRRN